ncbi:MULTISPECIES: transposase [Lysinibacillus]|uniref:Transposase n=1 Tax=Lysinibacillus antri TaxID=2498145 RepID=A0A432LHM1_9BACI|nr:MULTISPECIES: transposase [Lysinibacillus]RUL56542.1 transposase [Lysinibacillus antri]TSI03048.1 transposase [Lysinibacillus sp. BW-2-10]
MARKKRIWSPYHFNHVVMRGNNRQNIFNNVDDFREFFRVVQYARQKYPFTIITYCIMTNHYHLLIRSPEVPLGKVMAIINRRYSDYFKKKYHYTGQLYERRYFADLIKSPIALLTISRYIHRNPIATIPPIVQKMEHYPYSSYRYYKTKLPSPYLFVDTDYLPSLFLRIPQQRSKSYLAFCENEEIRSQPIT